MDMTSMSSFQCNIRGRRVRTSLRQCGLVKTFDRCSPKPTDGRLRSLAAEAPAGALAQRSTASPAARRRERTRGQRTRRHGRLLHASARPAWSAGRVVAGQTADKRRAASASRRRATLTAADAAERRMGPGRGRCRASRARTRADAIRVPAISRATGWLSDCMVDELLRGRSDGCRSRPQRRSSRAERPTTAALAER